MNTRTAKNRDSLNIVASGLVIFSIIYMIGFPKGGVKIYNVPLTIGYLLSAAMIALALTRVNLARIPINRIIILIFSAILTAWSWGVIFENGFTASGFALAYFTSVSYLPLFGMIVFSGLIMEKMQPQVEFALKLSIRIVITYGILLFAYKYFTGKWIEIPYLTVNADDVGSLDDKYIDRGGIFKLISTYNNGNIFGVCMAMLGPIYFFLEKNKYFICSFIFAMVLTLSRTVWIGVIILSVVTILSGKAGPKKLVNLAVFSALGLLVLTAILGLMGRDLSFLFDKNLGGRATQLIDATEVGLVSTSVFRGISEIVYVGMINAFGFMGLILFLFYLLTPIILLILGGTPIFKRRPDSACLQGLIIYAILAGSDGAFILIPVMMIFWMIAGLGLWYQRQGRQKALVAR